MVGYVVFIFSVLFSRAFSPTTLIQTTTQETTFIDQNSALYDASRFQMVFIAYEEKRLFQMYEEPISYNVVNGMRTVINANMIVETSNNNSTANKLFNSVPHRITFLYDDKKTLLLYTPAPGFGIYNRKSKNIENCHWIKCTFTDSLFFDLVVFSSFSCFSEL